MSHPIEKKKRVEQIDVIRGFALMGVLLVNMTMIDGTLYSSADPGLEGINLIFQKAIHFFAVGKFYTLFSMLFGLGFYYFMKKDEGELIGKKLYKRRLMALFCFGLLHLMFVWHGDILHVYALVGIFLMLNTNTSSAKLLKRAVFLFILSTVMMVLLQSGSGGDAFAYDDIIKETTEVYTEGRYFEVVAFRVTQELPLIAMNFLFVLPKILCLFLLGYAVGKVQLFDHLEEHHKGVKRVWLTTGILFVLIGLLLQINALHLLKINIIVLLDEVSTVVGALFYATSLILLYRTKIGKRLLTPLKYAGQMALTNYLVQTVVMTFFFYGYGFGQFEKLPYWTYIPMMLTLYGAQLVVSTLWMTRHRFGPMEKLWRTLTYGRSHLKV